jgi:hypothetical protein
MSITLNGRFARAPFRDALLAVAGRGGAVNVKTLGRWLLRNKGRIVGGVRLEQAQGRRNNAAVWRLLKS